MALKLDQIKRGKAPKRKTEGASSFIKDKTLAPFEIPPPMPDGSLNERESAQSLAPHSPTLDTVKIEIDQLNSSESPSILFRAQLEHNQSTKKESSIEEETATAEDNSESSSVIQSTIRAQSKSDETSKSVSNQSTIRAQDHIKESISPTKEQLIGVQLEHNIQSTNDSLIRAQSEHRPDNKESKERTKSKICSDSNKINNQSTIRAHIEDIELIRVQLEHKSRPIGAQTDNNKVSDQSTNQSLIRAQSEHRTPIRSDYESLSGHELNFLKFIHKNCMENGSKTTSRLNHQLISEVMNINPNALKTVIKRVVDKGFIFRNSGKSGRGGWLQFSISEELYTRMLFTVSNQSTNRVHAAVKQSTVESTVESTTSSSSSSLLINNINTTTEEKQIWNEITIPEFLRTKGFSITHAKQILSDKDNTLTVEDLQESFDNFAVDLENGVMNIKISPVVFFMGIVRKNRTKYESRFVNEQLEKEIANYLAQQKQSESLLKDKAQMELIKKFQEWASGLSQEEKNQYVPPSNVVEEGSGAQEIMLKSYFFEKQGIKL